MGEIAIERTDAREGVAAGRIMILMLAAAFAANWAVQRLREEPPPPEEGIEAEEEAVSTPERSAETARPEPPRLLTHPYFRDPHGSMRRFYRSLAAAETRSLGRPVRILYFGTSEIGFDRVTGQLRRVLQQRFGDGGKGFLVAAPGWRYQRHMDVVWDVSDGWTTYTALEGKRPDGLYGLGGVLAVGREPASIRFASVPPDHTAPEGYHPFRAGTRFSRFRLFYQAYPSGGELNVETDGILRDTLRTNAYEERDAFYELRLADGPHEIRLRPGKKPVRLYGAAFERDRGVVIDALMTVGGETDTLLNYDAEHLKRQAARRRPDLVVFQLGAKELFDNTDFAPRKLRSIRKDYLKSVRRVLAGAPDASCLVVSPKDMGMHERNLIVTRPSVPKMVAASEEVSLKAGCAFMDLYRALGGEGAMARWFDAEPRMVSPDLGHVMRPGAVKVGSVMAGILLEGYDQLKPAPGP